MHVFRPVGKNGDRREGNVGDVLKTYPGQKKSFFKVDPALRGGNDIGNAAQLTPENIKKGGRPKPE